MKFGSCYITSGLLWISFPYLDSYLSLATSQIGTLPAVNLWQICRFFWFFVQVWRCFISVGWSQEIVLIYRFSQIITFVDPGSFLVTNKHFQICVQWKQSNLLFPEFPFLRFFSEIDNKSCFVHCRWGFKFMNTQYFWRITVLDISF